MLFLKKKPMKHNVKTAVFKVLDILPKNIGYKIYHKLQEFSENKNIPYKINSCQITYNSLNSILKNLNYTLENKTIAEIGSGWLPIMPYLFLYEANAKKVLTFDLNEHFQKKNIQKFNVLFSNQKNKKLVVENDKYNLPKEVEYFPKTNIIDFNLENIDVVFSRFVLEHVTPNDLKEMHEQFKKLKPNSLIVHYISPSDHRAFSDSRLSLQDFLKFSEKEWNNTQTKFDYHNRLRLPQYLQIFNDLGYSIEYLYNDNALNNPTSLEKFNKLNIHSDFKQYSIEDLTAGSIIVILKC